MTSFHKLFALFSPRERIHIFLLLAAMLIGAVLEAAGIGLILPLMSLLNEPGVINDYPTALRFLAEFNITGTREIIITACIAVLVFYFFKNTYLAFLISFQYSIIYKKQASLSSRLLKVYLHNSWAFHLQRNTAELLRNITHQITILFGNVLNPLIVLTTEILVTLAIVSVLVVAEPIVSISAIIFLGGFALTFYRFTHRKANALGKQQQQYMFEMMKAVNQALGGLKETKILGRENYFLHVYSTNVKGYVRAHKYLWTLNNIPRLFLETLVVFGLLLVSVLVLLNSQNTSSLLPVLALFAAAAFRIMPSFNRVLVALSTIQYHKPAIDVVYRDLLLSEGSDDNRKPESDSEKLPFRNKIHLQDVCFRYPEAEQDTLNHVSMTIAKGVSAALVGPSGAGKTTLVDVILGLLKPAAGKVLVDGRDIHENLRAWQRQIGYIPQVIYLSDDTIRRNVAFGIPDEVIDDQKVWNALKSAQLQELVREKPDGLDTMVGERGVRLSGGQRQRIGIARALYHDPEVLVLDEATSSLDTETEREITKTIDHLSSKKTLIIIAHRLTTVENCDVRFVLQDGALKDEIQPAYSSTFAEPA